MSVSMPFLAFYTIFLGALCKKNDEKIAWSIYKKAIDLLKELSYNLINKNKQIKTQSNK